MSPDFRQRASSNASSVGRLSPIPSLALENDWNNYEFIGDDDTALGNEAPNSILEDLAGTLADELTLQNDLFSQGSVLNIKFITFHHHISSHTNYVREILFAIMTSCFDEWINYASRYLTGKVLNKPEAQQTYRLMRLLLLPLRSQTFSFQSFI